jgi:hypothetical protein
VFVSNGSTIRLVPSFFTILTFVSFRRGLLDSAFQSSPLNLTYPEDPGSNASTVTATSSTNTPIAFFFFRISSILYNKKTQKIEIRTPAAVMIMIRSLIQSIAITHSLLVYVGIRKILPTIKHITPPTPITPKPGVTKNSINNNNTPIPRKIRLISETEKPEPIRERRIAIAPKISAPYPGEEIPITSAKIPSINSRDVKIGLEIMVNNTT